MNHQSRIKISARDNGIHLEDSIVWFDSVKSGEVSFLSSALQQSAGFSRKTQIIQTLGTAKILEALGKKTKSLVCQFNRPFSVGSIKMELLPAGSVLGSSSLFLEHNGERLLYAPCAQPQKHILTRKMQLKKTDTLLVDASLPNLKISLPSRKKEKERLLDKVVQYKLKNGVYPIITASSVGVSQELTQLFSSNNIPVLVHPMTGKINKVYEDCGIKLGSYKVFSKRNSSNDRLMIMPFATAFQRTFNLPEGRDIFAVAHDVGSYLMLEDYRDFYETFALNTKADGPELKEIIAAAQPDRILITGQYVQKYLNEFKSLSKKIRPVYKNDQPSFFD